jgi:lipid II:glycine glycyltransferase (peptidoglycan interpeptide bridge formation enzyme)
MLDQLTIINGQKPGDDGSFIINLPKTQSTIKIKPLTLGEKIAMNMTPNDNAPISDASTLVARLEEHSDFAHKVVRDLLREASERIQFLTKERDYFEMKMTFYAKDAQREANVSLGNTCTEDIINNYKHGTGWGKGSDE